MDNKPKKTNLKEYFIFALVLIFATSAAFFAGKYTTPRDQVLKVDNVEANSFFNGQSASIRGKVVKLAGNTATLENNSNKTRAEFEVSDRLPKPGDIKINQEALITLELMQGKYKIVSLVYISPAPTVPPFSPSPKSAASESGKPANK